MTAWQAGPANRFSGRPPGSTFLSAETAGQSRGRDRVWLVRDGNRRECCLLRSGKHESSPRYAETRGSGAMRGGASRNQTADLLKHSGWWEESNGRIRIAGDRALCLVALRPKQLGREGVLWAEHQFGERLFAPSNRRSIQRRSAADNFIRR